MVTVVTRPFWFHNAIPIREEILLFSLGTFQVIVHKFMRSSKKAGDGEMRSETLVIVLG